MARLVTTHDPASIEHVLSDAFIHHRPDSTSSTKKEWLEAVRVALIPLADMQVEIRHVLAEGDHVVMHSRRWLPDTAAEIAVVDIWRLENGLITEAWELIEPTSQAPANLTWWETARPS